MSRKKIFAVALIFAMVTAFGRNVFTPMADTIGGQRAEKKT